MIVIPATLPTVLDALALHWQAQPAHERAQPAAVLAPGESLLARLQALALPTDFESFYRNAAGEARALPRYAIEEDFHFFTVAELRPYEKDLLVISTTGAAKERVRVTVFVNYRETSWEYGVIADPMGEGYRIGMLAYPGEFKVITHSLATFLCLYLEDASALYEYQTPYTPNHS